ncbi:hypothetical protein [Paenibacillus sp. Marseille-Q4541]|uniref:hypothetical protein n=1 Tax=Paenibacillus sp. Marseille-Q4541 TaxID=2831522 RepID=UPI001BA98B9E|nr:hypothetical protein [Paenibacillus sp. Marseille-Q4541]
MSVIKYTGSTAILYVEEIEHNFKIEMESLYYLVKDAKGNWLIHDSVDIYNEEMEFKYEL